MIYENPYGPLVIGEEAARAIAAKREGGLDRYGSLVTSAGGDTPSEARLRAAVAAPAAPAPEVQLREAAGADNFLSVAELTRALRENPALVDTFLAAERERPAGPRKSALAALLNAEQSAEDGRAPREPVVAEIAALIGAPRAMTGEV